MPAVGLAAIYGVQAPAKLNLFLHVTGQRPDGYHLLQSVFMLIDWCDLLHFEQRRDGVISRCDAFAGNRPYQPPLPALPLEDLCIRAARALQAATGTALGAHITLEKHIPAQAGMGGGSSDAAACLLALQRLWGVRLPAAQLQAIALLLGADVPFFLAGSHAWVEGVGEQITPIALPDAELWVVKPAVGVSTPAIFASPDLVRNTPTAAMTRFVEAAANPVLEMAAAPDSAWFAFGRNDLQPVAAALCPEIGQALAWLATRGLKGRMSGSGSAVFAWHPAGGAMPGGNCDLSAMPDLPAGWTMRKCKLLAAHPLAGW